MKRKKSVVKKYRQNSRREFFVIAHNIRSVYNVGSIFRSADAFGVSKVFLTGYTPSPDNVFSGSKIGKTALGAEASVAWESAKSALALIGKLKKTYPKIQVVGLDNNIPAAAGVARPVQLDKFKPRFPLALVLGEEVQGIEPRLLKLCDRIVEIPMRGQKESLNVSVAFGVAAYVLTNLSKKS